MKLERKLFSENKDRLKKSGLEIAAGAATVYGGSKSLDKLVDHISNNFAKNIGKFNPEDSKKLKEELLKEAKRQGTRVVKVPEYNNAAYTGTSEVRKLKDYFAAQKRKARKENDTETIKKIDKDLDDFLKKNKIPKKFWKHMGKDSIVIGSDFNSPDILSHEIGHSKFIKSGRSKNIIARGAHKLYVPSSKFLTTKEGKAGKGLSLIHGIHNGYKSEKMKQDGKEESSWHKISSVALPIIASSPVLISEAAASKKGLSLLKKSGASKETLKHAREQLTRAWNTYAATTLSTAIAGEGGRLIGKGVAKLSNKKEE